MTSSFVQRNRAYLETMARRACSSVTLTPEHVLCRVLGKYLMYVDPHDFGITPHLTLNGCWEPWITLALARLVQPGWRCLDVGANVGYYSLILAEGVGPNGRVMAIDPNPDVLRLLQLNLHVNGLASRVDVRGCAAWENEGKSHLSISRHDPGQASVCIDQGADASRIEVDTTTLDRLTADWPRVDLIKIDAEGAEPQIWRGMQEMLARNPTVAVVMEFAPRRYPEPDYFLDEITTQGFVLRQIAADGTIALLDRAQITSALTHGDWVMLFLVRS